MLIFFIFLVDIGFHNSDIPKFIYSKFNFLSCLTFNVYFCSILLVEMGFHIREIFLNQCEYTVTFAIYRHYSDLWGLVSCTYFKDDGIAYVLSTHIFRRIYSHRSHGCMQRNFTWSSKSSTCSLKETDQMSEHSQILSTSSASRAKQACYEQTSLHKHLSQIFRHSYLP